MAVIDDLVDRIEDVELKKRIQIELQKLTKQKKFGLVFENHLPECTPLYEIAVTPGRDVAERTGPINEIWTVLQISGNTALCRRKNGQTIQEFPIDELVAVASFGEPIYPYLKPIDSLCNAPESDLWHTIIEADNYHALQLLEYLYTGKIDCIYIDPPYNTGARDWKYNNNYVDGSDAYRHSKWLSFMDKRLRLAKNLLNPQKSVLIVTIDEKEQSRLGCLLDEIFPNASIQMITSLINPKGSVREKRFTRCDEYIYFVFIGDGACIECNSDYLNVTAKKEKVRWPSLKRTGTNSRREDRANLFFPLFYSKITGKFLRTGESIPPGVPRSSIACAEDEVAIWPLDDKGNERIWQLSQKTISEYLKKGFISMGVLKQGKASPNYLSSGLVAQVMNGEIISVGKNDDGSLQLEYASGQKKETPKTIWNLTSHSASEHGTNLLFKIFGEKRFSYPKSLYAVKDTLYTIIGKKKDALVIDFFAGSGTTLHAVNLMNEEDKGSRRCILVTNNELSERESKFLLERGIKPGDEAWNELGIARHITWPRTVCSIRGCNIHGKPLVGKYIDSDRPLSDGLKANVEFLKLGFLDKAKVSLGQQFEELLPILWLKAGAHGPCPNLNQGYKQVDMLIFNENKMGVLFDVSSFKAFKARLNGIETVYIVTDNERSYQSMVSELNVKNTYQLYRDYLDNFRINKYRG